MKPIDHNIIQHLQKDKILQTAIEKTSLIIEDPKLSLFEHMIRSIVSQQLSIKAAETIHNRFRNSFTEQILFPELVLQKSNEEMRSYGLSYQKASYIKNIAEYFLEHNLLAFEWHKLTDEMVIQKLVPIKGVGVWTIQMILIFFLQREDVFPVDDLAIRNRIIKWYGLEGRGKELILQIHGVAESWKPYRSLACRYIWAAGDNL